MVALGVVGVGFSHWLHGAESPLQWFAIAVNRKEKLFAAVRTWAWEYVPSQDGYAWVDDWLAPNVVGVVDPQAVLDYYLGRGFTWLDTDEYPPEPPPLT